MCVGVCVERGDITVYVFNDGDKELREEGVGWNCLIRSSIHQLDVQYTIVSEADDEG